VQAVPNDAKLLHYTLGGPWFDDCREMVEGERWRKARAALAGAMDEKTDR
jgi:hypothetical protein